LMAGKRKGNEITRSLCDDCSTVRNSEGSLASKAVHFLHSSRKQIEKAYEHLMRCLTLVLEYLFVDTGAISIERKQMSTLKFYAFLEQLGPPSLLDFVPSMSISAYCVTKSSSDRSITFITTSASSGRTDCEKVTFQFNSSWRRGGRMRDPQRVGSRTMSSMVFLQTTGLLIISFQSIR
jgi:hypothetical protein